MVLQTTRPRAWAGPPLQWVERAVRGAAGAAMLAGERMVRLLRVAPLPRVVRLLRVTPLPRVAPLPRVVRLLRVERPAPQATTAPRLNSPTVRTSSGTTPLGMSKCGRTYSECTR